MIQQTEKEDRTRANTNPLGKKSILIWYLKRRSFSDLLSITIWAFRHIHLARRFASKLIRLLYRRLVPSTNTRALTEPPETTSFSQLSLVSDRLLLRPVSIDDMNGLAEYFPIHNGVQFVGKHPPPTWWIDLRFVSDLLNDTMTWTVLCSETNTPVGCAAIGEYSIDGRKEIELGYWIAGPFHGNGFATEATFSILRSLNELHPGIRVISIIAPSNIASIRVAEKNGMSYEKTTTFFGGQALVYVYQALSDECA